MEWLLKCFIKNYQDTKNQKVRQQYGMLGGTIGICLNLFLFAGKFMAGLITSSIAITADAFNNLSDAGSSILTLVGFKMAGKPADKLHPFGHGRIEYLAGVGISIAIFLMGIELVKTSIEKIVQPEVVTFSSLSMIILVVSIGVKLWMCFFNRSLGKRIDSATMKATAMDSLNDAIATSAVLLGLFVGQKTGFAVDGYVGLLVAIFILYTGYQTAKDSLSPLVGQAPDWEFVKEIENTVLSYPEIVGIHDLIVHNYGPGQSMVSLHAEVPCDMDMIHAHDIIDTIEFDLKQKFDCEATIHMDPIAVDNARINDLKDKVIAIVQTIDPRMSIHDFRLTDGPRHSNLIFDVVAPYNLRMNDEELRQRIRREVQQLEGGNFYAVVQVDKSYLGEHDLPKPGERS